MRQIVHKKVQFTQYMLSASVLFCLQPPPTIVGARSRAANAHLRHCQQQSFPRFFHRNNKSHGACYIKLEHIIDLKQYILQQHAALALGAGAVMQRLCEVHNAGTNVDAA